VERPDSVFAPEKHHLDQPPSVADPFALLAATVAQRLREHAPLLQLQHGCYVIAGCSCGWRQPYPNPGFNNPMTDEDRFTWHVALEVCK